MAQLFKIALWNANGLVKHKQEVETFLIHNNIDILLLSETHFTSNAYFNIKNFTLYHTTHPDADITPRGGTAILVKQYIKHYELPKYQKNFLQATSIVVEDWHGPLTISAAYCPPNYPTNKEETAEYFTTLGNRFLAGGDYNAKNTAWGSRLTAPGRGRVIYNIMQDLNLNHLSTYTPTYWPTDPDKLPDLLDFFITKGIAAGYLAIESNLDLYSDHTPVIATVSGTIIEKDRIERLYNKRTNWEYYKHQIEQKINLNIPLKTEPDVELAINHLNNIIQESSRESTPDIPVRRLNQNCPIIVKQKIAEKRRLRRIWQRTRYPQDKNRYDKASRELKNLITNLKNKSFNEYLENLTNTADTNYSLWKAARNIKCHKEPIPPIRKPDRTWARTDLEKAYAFAHHLEKVFQPLPSQAAPIEEARIKQNLEAPFQMSPLPKLFTAKEVTRMIKNNLNSKKAPGYDDVTGKLIKELPKKGIVLLTIIFNAILRLGYFPAQWKVAKVILIPKPGKPPQDVSSYRPISLLPILSKLLEKLLLTRLAPHIESNNLLPDHQFGFRQKHSTIEQVHRVVNNINQAFEDRNYCVAAFLDVSQAFDKVWHQGLLYKLKNNFPHTIYIILESYLHERYFMVNYGQETTELFPVQSGVPQGSVLGPILYLLFTADLPTSEDTTTASFADDKAIMANHPDLNVAANHLQQHLDKIQDWTRTWRIKINELKSTQVTFTKRRGITPPITLNGQILPQSDSVKYLGIHLDRGLTWRTHIHIKRKQLGLKFREYYWLLGRQSKLTLNNKLLIYKVALKPIWTYGVQLWGTAAKSHLEIVERFQSKVLRTITNAPWYIPNREIRSDLEVNSVKQEISEYSGRYLKRLDTHPNVLAVNLLDNSEQTQRLKRFKPLELPYRF